MSMNDPLAAALSKIENAERVGKADIELTPVSKVIKQVLTILNERQYIGAYEEDQTARGVTLRVSLIHNINKVGAIKPRFSFQVDDFENVEKEYLPAKDFGIIIVTTSEGIMTLAEAKEKHLGGKLLAYCY